MMYPALGLLCGILFQLELPNPISSLWLIPAVTASYFLWKPCRAAALVLLFAAIGAVYLSLVAQARLDRLIPASWQQQALLAEGEIASVIVDNGRRQRFDFLLQKVNNRAIKPLKIRLAYYYSGKQANKALALWPGDRFRFWVRLKRPHGFHNPYGFDYQAWLLQNNYAATAYVNKLPEKAFLASNPWSYPLQSLRYYLMQKAQQVLAGVRQAPEADSNSKREDYSGVFLALVLGIKSSLPQAQRELMQATGTAHLLAISGLHVGLITLIFYVIGQSLWRFSSYLQQHFVRQHFALFPAALAALSYAALAGFSVATQRALIMFLVIALARLLYRNSLNWNVLYSSLFIVLLLQPFAPLNPGFWLSFYAVAVIFWVLQWQQKYQWPKPLLFLLMQLILSLATLPLLLVFFHSAGIGSFVANLFAVPFAALLIIPGSFLFFVLLTAFPSIAALLAVGLQVLLDFYFFMLGWVEQKLIITISTDIPFSLPLLALLVIGWFLLTRKWKTLLVSGYAVMFLMIFARPESKKLLEMEVFDVGQGTAVLLSTGNHHLLYDTGHAWSEHFSAVKAVILPYLKAKGVDHLDKLVLSHSDQDHIGDYRYLLKQLAVKQLESGQPAFFSEKFDACQQIKPWQWDNVSFRYLVAPLAEVNDNNQSCVLQIRAGNTTLLLSGDIEQSQEAALLQRYGKNLHADVLLVPHHGSKSSSSTAFLQQLSPKAAISSNGWLNRFGHPHKLVVQRYRQQGIRFYQTDRSGAISVLVYSQGFDVQTAKQRFFYHWYNFFN